MKQGRKTFTLIELLVVVAIIGILASMLLPALTKARDRARSTQCQGFLKQQVMALQFYADEYNGIVPGSHWLMEDGKDRRWHAIPVYYNRGLTKFADYYDRVYSGSKGRDFGVMRCPGDGTVTSDGRTFINYGYNGVYSANDPEPSHQKGMDRRRVSSVDHSSEVMFIGDGMSNIYGGDGSSYRICNLNPGIYDLHTAEITIRHPNNTANYAFVDGHVGSRSLGFLLDELAKGGANSIFWDQPQKY